MLSSNGRTAWAQSTSTRANSLDLDADRRAFSVHRRFLQRSTGVRDDPDDVRHYLNGRALHGQELKPDDLNWDELRVAIPRLRLKVARGACADGDGDLRAGEDWERPTGAYACADDSCSLVSLFVGYHHPTHERSASRGPSQSGSLSERPADSCRACPSSHIGL
jgi:hypothetical protein